MNTLEQLEIEAEASLLKAEFLVKLLDKKLKESEQANEKK